MSVLFPKLESLLLKLQLLRAELDEQGARTPSGAPQTQASPAPRSASPLLQHRSLKSMWGPTSLICVLVQVLEAKSGTCFSHVKWFEIKALESPPGSLSQTAENWCQEISPAVGLRDLQELAGPLSSQPRSVIADPRAGICPSGSVYSAEGAWTSGLFSLLQRQCRQHSTFPAPSSPPGPRPVPTPLSSPRLKSPSQTLVRNTENLRVRRKIYFFLHLHTGSPWAVIFR